MPKTVIKPICKKKGGVYRQKIIENHVNEKSLNI